MINKDDLNTLLLKTSRTFALTIPMLPEPTRTEVGVAYLLFRIIDTFEDATAWSPERRIQALAEVGPLLDEADPRAVAQATSAWLVDPPVIHAGYLDLLRVTPQVVSWYHSLAPRAREQLRLHLGRSARGMADFVARTRGDGVLELETLQELRDYCFAVAGIVGQMLTELFVIGGPPSLEAAADELRGNAVRFGEGLQLVNILKDARPDAVEGRRYLPRQVQLPEVFVMARADLTAAAAYTDALRAHGADRGLVAFNAINTRLAIATLRLLRDQGLGSKLGRLQVTGLVAEVMHALEVGGPLFPEVH
jgi:farnesyl-diphosphate farnesyltransferase